MQHSIHHDVCYEWWACGLNVASRLCASQYDVWYECAWGEQVSPYASTHSYMTRECMVCTRVNVVNMSLCDGMSVLEVSKCPRMLRLIHIWQGSVWYVLEWMLWTCPYVMVWVCLRWSSVPVCFDSWEYAIVWDVVWWIDKSMYGWIEWMLQWWE